MLTQEKKIFKSRQCIFPVSLLSPLGKVCDPLFEQKTNALYHRMLCASLVEVGLVYLHLEKGLVLSLNKHMHEFALPKGILCRVWLRLALPAGRGRPYRANLLRHGSSCLLYTEDRVSCIAR